MCEASSADPPNAAESPVSREISGLCNLASFRRRLNSSDHPFSISFWAFANLTTSLILSVNPLGK